MNIPDKALEAATVALHQCDTYIDDLEWARKDARDVLEAAAPFIAAQALRDAAGEAEEDELATAGEVVKDLRRSADKLEARA